MIVIPSASRSENSILGNLTHARESEAISSLDVGLGEEELMLGLGDYIPILLVSTPICTLPHAFKPDKSDIGSYYYYSYYYYLFK